MRGGICFLFTLGLLLSGCGLVRAPEVEAPRKAAAETAGLPTPVSLGVADLGGGPENGGLVSISLRKRSDDDVWAYWKAGTSQIIYQPNAAFARSAEWDMRVTKYFPLVGSNGGETAQDEGFVDGKAAFAVIPDARGGFIPTRIDEVLGLSFIEDRFESLEFEGVRLAPEYQNALVNTIGPGLLKSYSMRDHTVELSYRIFILRTVDGGSYYAIRFYHYSRAENVALFQWRRLQ